MVRKDDKNPIETQRKKIDIMLGAGKDSLSGHSLNELKTWLDKRERVYKGGGYVKKYQQGGYVEPQSGGFNPLTGSAPAFEVEEYPPTPVTPAR